jgi:hypothetical protein
VADLVPSQPKPVTSVPLAWERTYGGADPTDPRCTDARNPAGSGVASDPKTLHGKPAPQIEDLERPLGVRMGMPSPIGFGPIAQHWQSRVALAGTYDEGWQLSRRPLPPTDFSPEFFNLAPLDQQLDRYTPGDVVRLSNMTAAGLDQFRLPDAKFPVTIVTSDELSEAVATIDTVIIEPAQRRFALLAKAQAELAGGASSLGQMIVGDLTAGMRKAIETAVVISFFATWCKPCVEHLPSFEREAGAARARSRQGIPVRARRSIVALNTLRYGVFVVDHQDDTVVG